MYPRVGASSPVPDSPDRLLKIQRKTQLRNAILDRFRVKHLRH